jgi:hypothetical protein
MSLHHIYWNDRWDRALTVIALKNTRRYEKKHPFPEYNKRNEKTKKSPKPARKRL